MSASEEPKVLRLRNGRSIQLTREEFDEIKIKTEWHGLPDSSRAKNARDMTDSEFSDAVRRAAWRGQQH